MISLGLLSFLVKVLTRSTFSFHFLHIGLRILRFASVGFLFVYDLQPEIHSIQICF